MLTKSFLTFDITSLCTGNWTQQRSDKCNAAVKPEINRHLVDPPKQLNRFYSLIFIPNFYTKMATSTYFAVFHIQIRIGSAFDCRQTRRTGTGNIFILFFGAAQLPTGEAGWWLCGAIRFLCVSNSLWKKFTSVSILEYRYRYLLPVFKMKVLFFKQMLSKFEKLKREAVMWKKFCGSTGSATLIHPTVSLACCRSERVRASIAVYFVFLCL
jgi:hypothetical protein